MTNDELENENRELKKMIAELGGQVTSLINVLTVNKPGPSRMLFDWLDDWLRTYKASEVSPDSFYQLKNCIDKHFKPNIENVDLNSLSPIDLDKAFKKIQSTRMRKYTYDTVCAALTKAYVLDIMAKDVAAKTQKVRHNRKKREPLTKEEEQRFLKIIPHSKYYLLWLFYLVSGVRRAEALNIKWSDVDYENNRLFINGTKTAAAKRFIPLFDDIKYILSKLPRKSEYLFPYKLYSVRNTFDYMREKYVLPFTIHNLRHTFATRHSENKISDNVIQHWLGHSSVTTTRDIYIHLTGEHEQKEAIKANELRRLTPENSGIPLYRISKLERRKNELTE